MSVTMIKDLARAVLEQQQHRQALAENTSGTGGASEAAPGASSLDGSSPDAPSLDTPSPEAPSPAPPSDRPPGSSTRDG